MSWRKHSGRRERLRIAALLRNTQHVALAIAYVAQIATLGYAQPAPTGAPKPPAQSSTKSASTPKPAAKSPAKAAAPKSAAPPAEQKAQVYPLESLKIEGNKKFPTARIIAASGLKIGQPVTKESFDAARNTLLATGGFESVGYEFNPSAAGTGYDAKLEVVETMPLFRYRFEELPVSDDDLRAALAKEETLFGDEIPASREVLARYEAVLNKILAGKVVIEARVNNERMGEPQILFHPPGERPRVSEIHFEGSEAIGAPVLAGRFAPVAIGAIATDPNIRQLLDANIRPLFEAKGRLRVKFTKIAIEPSKEKDVLGVSLTVTVDDGPVYELGDVTYVGVPRNQQAELSKLANWPTKDTADFDRINAGVQAVIKRYRSIGYLHVEAKADRKVDDAKRTVDLTVTVDAKDRYTFGKLEIRGLDILTEPAIRKMWGEKSGKPFDPEFPDSFLKEVRDQGVLDNLGETSSQSSLNESNKTVDVDLMFKGAPPPDRKQRRGIQF